MEATVRTGPAELRAALRRTRSLPVEMGVLGLTVMAWQLARIPFETTVPDATAATLDWIAAERGLGIFREPSVVRWFAARPDLLSATEWFYAHMDQTLVFGAFAVLRLLDPLRYPPIRTAFVLAHVPAIAVVALSPTAPPHWTPGAPYGAPPDGLGGDLVNSTAAAVSLHVGVPSLVAAAALWLRPRAPLAWATPLYPLLVLAVVVGTGNHLLLDAVVGIGCVAIGAAAAALVHGPTPAGRPEATPGRIALAGVTWAGIAFAAHIALLMLPT